MPRMTAPNGATVSVADGKVAELERRGFVTVEAKKAPAKKAAPRKSGK